MGQLSLSNTMRELQNIIGHAKHVMRVLGKGHRENVYAKALQTSFNKSMIVYRSEVCCPIIYLDEIIGYGRADFVLDNFIIEIKANRMRTECASDQLDKYIKSLNKIEKKRYVGIIINFNQQSGEVDVLQQGVVASRFFNKKK